LRSFGDTQALEAWVGILDDRPESFASALLDLRLIKIPPTLKQHPAATEALKNALGSDQPKKRLYAAVALGALQEPSSFEPLMEMLREADTAWEGAIGEAWRWPSR